MQTRHPVLNTLPELPPSAGVPWPAEVVQAHRGLHSAFRASRTALNLDESNPIRLGHHLHQARTFMTSIINVLTQQTTNPLPVEYIRDISENMLVLVDALQTAFTEASARFVVAAEPGMQSNAHST